jgi:hypothetical protein
MDTPFKAQGKEAAFGGNSFLQGWNNMTQPLQGFLKNPFVAALASLNPITAALRAIGAGPTSTGSTLGGMLGSSLGPLGSLAGSLGGGQLANYGTTGEFMPIGSSQMGSMGGSLLGGALSGNALGASAGGFLGGQLMSGMNYGGGGGPDTTNSSGGYGNNYGDIGYAGGPNSSGGWQGVGPQNGGGNMQPTNLNDGGIGALAALFGNHQANKAYGDQIKSLQGLYGQDSSYAQAMRQQLDRRDAAAGRRSQYGPREVELQAALAGNASRLAPTIAGLSQNRLNSNQLLLASLFRNPSLMKGIGSGVSNGINGLSGLFDNIRLNNIGQSTNADNPWNTGGVIEDNGGGGW